MRTARAQAGARVVELCDFAAGPLRAMPVRRAPPAPGARTDALTSALRAAR